MMKSTDVPNREKIKSMPRRLCTVMLAGFLSLSDTTVIVRVVSLPLTGF